LQTAKVIDTHIQKGIDKIEAEMIVDPLNPSWDR
jgi:hypothetical protein